MFSPGETVTHKFRVPFPAVEMSKVVVSYKQQDHLVLEKNVTSFEEGDTPTQSIVTIVFSQDESLLFENDMPFTIQINVITTAGSRATSREMKGGTLFQHVREVI